MPLYRKTADNLIELGINGKDSSIIIGEVKSLHNSLGAYVRNSGTSTSAVLDFGIPKGKDGENAVSAINPRGDYNSGTIYSQNDYITYTDGNTYVWKKEEPSQNHPPTTGRYDDEYWQLVALKGADGNTPELLYGSTIMTANGNDPAVELTKLNDLQYQMNFTLPRGDIDTKFMNTALNCTIIVPKNTTYPYAVECQKVYEDFPEKIVKSKQYTFDSPYGKHPCICQLYLKDPISGIWFGMDNIYASGYYGTQITAPGDGKIYLTTGVYLNIQLIVGNSGAIAPITNTAKNFDSAEAVIAVWCASNIVAKGEPGATFTPAVDENGELTWTNDSGLDNPEPINIKGKDGTFTLEKALNMAICVNEDSDFPCENAHITPDGFPQTINASSFYSFKSPFGNTPCLCEVYLKGNGKWFQSGNQYHTGTGSSGKVESYGIKVSANGDGYIHLSCGMYLNYHSVTGNVGVTVPNVNFQANLKSTSDYAIVVWCATSEIGKGADGRDGTQITLGNVITGEPNTEAKIENRGTEKDQIWDITIPQGLSGEVSLTNALNMAICCNKPSTFPYEQSHITPNGFPESITVGKMYSFDSPYGKVPCLCQVYLKDETNNAFFYMPNYYYYYSSKWSSYGILAVAPGDGKIYLTTGKDALNFQPVTGNEGLIAPHTGEKKNQTTSSTFVVVVWCATSEAAKGRDGITFTPNVDEDCNLTWTNDGNVNNPPAVNIKGKLEFDTALNMTILTAPNSTFPWSKNQHLSILPATVKLGDNISIPSPYGNTPCLCEVYIKHTKGWLKQQPIISGSAYFGITAACMGDGNIYVTVSKNYITAQPNTGNEGIMAPLYSTATNMTTAEIAIVLWCATSEAAKGDIGPKGIDGYAALGIPDQSKVVSIADKLQPIGASWGSSYKSGWWWQADEDCWFQCYLPIASSSSVTAYGYISAEFGKIGRDAGFFTNTQSQTMCRWYFPIKKGEYFVAVATTANVFTSAAKYAWKIPLYKPEMTEEKVVSLLNGERVYEITLIDSLDCSGLNIKQIISIFGFSEGKQIEAQHDKDTNSIIISDTISGSTYITLKYIKV